MGILRKSPAAIQEDVALEDPEILDSLDTSKSATEGAKDPAPGDPNRVAVFVCHGMGQQVRFQTLEDVARALKRHLTPGGSKAASKLVVRQARIGATDLYRCELEIRGGDGQWRKVHLYEAYWAPLTEGKVGVRDVVFFLLGAAWKGLKNASRSFFRRWMFGGPKSLPMDAVKTRRRLILAAAAVLSLVLINIAIGLSAAGSLLLGGRAAWPPSWFLLAFTIEVGLLLVVGALTGGCIWVISSVRRRRLAGGSGPGPWGAARAAMILVWTFLILLITVGVLLLAEIALLPVINPSLRPPLALGTALGTGLVWGLALVGSWIIRYFLIQYVGDVAVYLSGNTVSRFNEVRDAIQHECARVAKAIYSALDPASGAFAYGRVVILGHSLGSVVAYETLNALIREDRVAKRSLRARERTALLMTFGSPLEKTAFIFRTQAKEDAEIREALAAAVQPMLQDNGLRPAKWRNIYSPHDWIGSRLTFYDDPATPNDPKNVQNEEDPWAVTPLQAHTEYWENPLLARRLVEAVL